MLSAYRALALQVETRAVNRLGPSDARRSMMETIERLDGQLRGSLAWSGPDTRLVVLPEYFLSGFPFGETIPEWREKAALEVDGPEYEALGQLAAKYGIFLSGNAYEVDEHYPELYFQCSFVLGPSGDCVLRYRRLNSMFAPTPHDVWSSYLDHYGLDGVFPVADTELGRIAAIASEEILYPEIARCLALRGAEVFVHSSSEASSPRSTPKGIAKRARALENLAFVVSCNSGGLSGIDIPGDSTNGGSLIVDFEGRVLTEAGAGESIVACAELDLGALRRYRARPGMGNLLSRQRLELFAQTYAESVYPSDTLSDQAPQRELFLANQRRALETLVERGVRLSSDEPTDD